MTLADEGTIRLAERWPVGVKGKYVWHVGNAAGN